MSKDLPRLIRAVKDEGWTPDKTRRGHHRLRCPNDCKCTVIISGTPGVQKWVDDARADLRRTCLGRDWDWRR